LLLFLTGVGIWAANGARLGWTQTSVVEVQRDEITGIDFPVRHDAFIPGVEVPLIGTAAALVLAGLSVLPQRSRRQPSNNTVPFLS
jgi:hypothetical protein